MKIHRYMSLLLILLIFNGLLMGCQTDTLPSANGYSDNLVIHFIDVGQGDSTFIQFPNGETSLIDGGSRKFGEKVVKYLKDLNINRIDYLIATHPHEDHIGGLPEVIRNFSISKVYMPDRTANTRIFEELLLEIKKKDLKITLAEGGDFIIDEDNLKFLILGPNRNDYSETNDFSIVTKIEYINNSFLIMGDAERDSELDIINNGYDLISNVIRVGHHGGSTSSNMEFVEKANPDYAVISVGADNPYGHPHKETLERLREIGTNVMRTDEMGDIIFESDGYKLSIRTFSLEKQGKSIKYIGNKNTLIFHTIECGSLPKEENRVYFDSFDEAIGAGYKPHNNCIKWEGH
ncbi:MAG: MBL fold metallo-hydrolase [Tissierellia bacterium]|nr:MBL fold metallo-hydrolase [Tissierellia bacterium]